MWLWTKIAMMNKLYDAFFFFERGPKVPGELFTMEAEAQSTYGKAISLGTHNPTHPPTSPSHIMR